MPEHVSKPAAVVAIAAIVSVTILESIALVHGIDGIGFGVAIAAIAGLGGFTLRTLVPPK